MNVLLIEPKYGSEDTRPWIPIGKAHMASVLRAHGFTVAIIDNALHGLSDKKLIGLMREFAPAIVGTGGMTLQAADSRRIARLVRQGLPSDVLLVGGGVHLTLVPDEGADDFDCIVLGEGEDTFLELCEAHRDAGRGPVDQDLLSNIPGLYYRSGDGEIIRTAARDFIPDLDRLPFPAYDLLEVEKYHDFLITGQRAMSVMSGRGCPFDCEFCASPTLSRRRVRYFSVDYALQHIRHVHETYGFRNFRIMDDTFTLNKRRVAEFCEGIQESGLRPTMTCLTHVKTGNSDMFSHMRRAGFSIVALGIESGNDRILALVNKKITTADAAASVREVKEAGMIVEGLFMIGNIGETRETIEDTIAFARDHNPPYSGFRRIGFNWFQFATPFPGSRFFREAGDYGDVVSRDYSDYSHQTPVFIPKGLDGKTMLRLREEALREANSPSNRLFRGILRARDGLFHAGRKVRERHVPAAE